MYKEFSYIYDKLMKTQVDYNLLVLNLLKICKKNNLYIKDILECAMGTGMLTEKFLEKNFNVDGFDISSDMLAVAYNRLEKFQNKNIFKADVRYFNIDKKYDLILCLFDCVNYLKTLNDIEKFLNNVYIKMKEDSIFFFDLNSEYKLKKYLGNNIFINEQMDIFYTWENFLKKTYIDFKINFFIKEKNLYKRIEETQRQYIYSEEEIEKIIQKVGFKKVEKLDFDTFEKVNEKSYRILYILKKQK